MRRTTQHPTRSLSLQAMARGGTLFFIFVVSLMFSAPGHCADAPNQNNYGGRKVLVRFEPEYPTDLRAASIGGYVHLNVTISPSGTVVSTEVIGGNPILAEAAKRAATKWKFSPAGSTTAAELWFHFVP